MWPAAESSKIVKTTVSPDGARTKVTEILYADGSKTITTTIHGLNGIAVPPPTQGPASQVGLTSVNVTTDPQFADAWSDDDAAGLSTFVDEDDNAPPVAPPGPSAVSESGDGAGVTASDLDLEFEIAALKASESVLPSTVEDASGVVVALTGLAESLFTTYYLDEDRFGFYTLSIVFTLAPIAEQTVKLYAYRTSPLWDDVAVDIISEGVQAGLFMFFCGFSDVSKLWIPIMMALQIVPPVALMIRRKCTKGSSTSGNNGRMAPLEAKTRCKTSSLVMIMAGLVPVGGVLVHGDIPLFYHKSNEMVFAAVIWLLEVALGIRISSVVRSQERADAEIELRKRASGEVAHSDEERQKIVDSYLADPRSRHLKLIKLVGLVSYLLTGYILVMFWMFMRDSDKGALWFVMGAIISVGYIALPPCYFYSRFQASKQDEIASGGGGDGGSSDGSAQVNRQAAPNSEPANWAHITSV